MRIHRGRSVVLSRILVAPCRGVGAVEVDRRGAASRGRIVVDISAAYEFFHNAAVFGLALERSWDRTALSDCPAWWGCGKLTLVMA